MSLASGTRLGPYEILSPIGAGGMGEVYKARDARLDRFVAVKVISEALGADPGALARFEREAKAVAALSHPNILSIFDFGHEGGTTYAVMELLEGRTLRERLAAGPLPTSKATDIAAQMAKGLAAAHTKGIVHRDLKPGNIFITDEGHVKILDFGLAKLRAPEPQAVGPMQDLPTAEARTSAGAVLGTMGYMAPEQARGLPADARSDIFSFGVVLYEMLSGKRAFGGDTASDLLVALLSKDPGPLPSVTPPGLDSVVRRCLEKRPEDRFSSAHDLAFALQAATSSGDLAGSRPGAATATTWWWARRYRAVLSLIAVLTVAVAGMALWRSWETSRRPASALVAKRSVVAVFENQTGDKSLDPVGKMASDWITEGLSRIVGAEVVPTSLVFALANAASASGSVKDPALALAEATGAGLVVSGTYYAQGQTLQVQAKVTDATEGKMIYALEPVTCPREKPMEAVEAVRRRVVDAVAAHNNISVDLLAEESEPPSYEAYQEFLRGEALSGEERVAHFTRALELDPSFMRPRFTLMADLMDNADYPGAAKQLDIVLKRKERLTPIQSRMVDWVRAELAGREDESLNAIREVVKLSPGDVWYTHLLGFELLAANRPREALEALTRPIHWELWTHPGRPAATGYFMLLDWALHRLGEYERELAEARRGRQIYPDVLRLRAWEARALIALGRLDDLEKLIQESLAVTSRAGTPGSVMATAAEELLAHGHREASIKMANRAADWFRTHPLPDAKAGRSDPRLAWSLYYSERWEEARAAFEALAKQQPDEVAYPGALGRLAARRGDTTEALRISEVLRKFDNARVLGEHSAHRACIAAQLGQKEQAVDLLREAVAQGFWYWEFFHREMDLEPLRGYPPFEEFIKPKG